MKAVKATANRSILLALVVVLFLSVTMLFASTGIVKSEINGLMSRASNTLGLSRQYLSGRRLLAHVVKVPAAMLEGRYPPTIDPLHIDVKFKDLQILREDRLKAIQQAILVDHREVNALVRHDGEVYRAKIRLKGDLPGHWREENRWSFRIELKDDASIWGMSEFSVHKPRERQYPIDQAFQEIVRATGNLSPRHTLFRVKFNGDDWGIMDAEEHVSKEMIELQGRKASIIIKLGNRENRWIYQRLNGHKDVEKGDFQLPFVRYGTLRETQPFDEKRVYATEHLVRLYSYLNAAILDYADGRIKYDDVFDADSYSQALLAAIVWNNIHTLGNANTRHYLNPYTLLLEPITTDQRRGTPLTLEPPERFSFTVPGAMSVQSTPEPYSDLFLNDSFWRGLESNLDHVLTAFSDVQAVFERQEGFFPLELIENPASVTVITENAQYLKDQAMPFLHALADRVRAKEDGGLGFSEETATVEAFEGEYPQHLIARHYSDGMLELENLLLEPVNLLTIRFGIGDKLQELEIAEQVIPPSTSSTPSIVRIPLSVDRLRGEERLFIESEVKGKRKSVELRGTLQTDIRNPLLQEKSIDYLLDAYPFFFFEDGELHVKEGTWSLSESIVLPQGVGLSIGPGTTLEFCTSCYLVAKAAIRLDGTETAPVRLLPQDQTWKGLYVLEAEGVSRFVHTEIAGTSGVEDSALVLTGGVVFYRSNIMMNDVRIVDARGEDALNLVRSDFSLQDLEICNTRSDGLDIDFSDGDIRRSTFCDIGGDALDMSGSVVRAEDFVAHDVHDKAVSAGERTQLSLVGARIERVGTGVVSKDSSTVEASDLVVREHRLFAAMVYQKKSFYGPSAVLSLQRVAVDDATEPFLAQIGSELRVDDKLIPTTVVDIDALYTTGPMKK